MSAGPENVIRLHPADNVVVARDALTRGTPVGGTGVATRALILPGHKVAVAAIAAGEPVRKFNQIIGFAGEAILPGDHVHVHNVVLRDFSRRHEPGVAARPTEFVPAEARATFEGYVREGGAVGTRNFMGIIPSVNCSATVARGIAGYARHPNFGGVLLIGLGCEVNQVDRLVAGESLVTGPRLRSMTIQQSGRLDAASTVASRSCRRCWRRPRRPGARRSAQVT